MVVFPSVLITIPYQKGIFFERHRQTRLDSTGRDLTFTEAGCLLASTMSTPTDTGVEPSSKYHTLRVLRTVVEKIDEIGERLKERPGVDPSGVKLSRSSIIEHACSPPPIRAR